MHSALRTPHSAMELLVGSFPAQWRNAVEIAEGFTGFHGTLGLAHVVVAGVGGSAIGGDCLRDVYRFSKKGPVIVNRTYDLPGWVDASTLLCVVSYSGNTEETLSAYRAGRLKRAQIVCVTSGGKLAKWARRDRVPMIELPQGYPPRAAFAYTFVPLARVLERAGWGSKVWNDVKSLSDLLDHWSALYTKKNFLLAKRLVGRGVVVATSEEFSGVGVRWKTQINENAKTHAYAVTLPEMNHNEILGWRTQRAAREWSLVLLRSRADHPRVQTRFDLSTNLWRQSRRPVYEVWADGSSSLARMTSLVYQGDWLSVKLAALQGIDAMEIPAIDWIKGQLSKNRKQSK